MSGISRMRSVTAAEKASATNGSSASWPPASSQRCVGTGCSVKLMPSNPAPSATRQNCASASLVRRSGLCGWVTNGYITENFIR